MKEPVKPQRKPDYEIGPHGFWWEERIQMSGWGGVYHFNPDNWTWYLNYEDAWRKFSGSYWDNIEHNVKRAYASWLIERHYL